MIAVCLLFVARALFVIPFNQPFLFADEVGYFANARHMAGRGNMAMLGSTFYNAGYSLLLIPTQLLASPEIGYQFALYTNCLIAALLFAALYSATRSVTGVSPNEALLISAAACLYPACSFWSYSAMSESTGAIILPLAVVTMSRFLERPRLSNGVWFCCVVVFGFAVHGRFAALPLFAVLVLFALRTRQRISWAHTWLLLAIITSLVAVIVTANAHFMGAMWDSSAGTSQVIARNALREIQKPGGLGRLLNFAAGQVSYIALATYGLAPVALAFLVMRVRWPSHSDGSARSRTLLVFLLMSALSVGILAAISSMYAFQAALRLGTFALLYGRYMDAVAPLLLAIGLATYAPSIRRAIPVVKAARLRIPFAVGSLLVPAIFLLSFAPDISSGLGFHETVSINHLAVLREPFNFGFAVMVVAVATVALDMFNRRRLGLGLAMMAVAFLAPSTMNYRSRLLAQRFQVADTAGIIKPLRSQIGPKSLAVDAASLDLHLFFALQYLLPDTTPVLFDSSKEQPHESLVLATLAWGPAADRDARVAGSGVWNSTGRQSVLWVRKSDPSYATYRDRAFPDLTMFASEMQGRTGRIRGLSRVATPTDAVDFLVFGQAIPLPEGAYSLEARYSVLGLREGQSAADWEVVLAAKTTLARGQLTENGPGRILRCSFGVPPEMSRSAWEFRVTHKGVATVRVDSVILRRSGPNLAREGLGNSR